MFKILQWLFLGHAHKWEIVSRLNYTDTSEGYRVPSFIVIRMCSVCKKHVTDLHYAEGYTVE